MTITRRLIVDLADIEALRIVCQSCHAVLSLSLAETVRVPEACPNCRMDWDEVQYGQQTRPVDQFSRALKGQAKSSAFRVQLELPAE